MGKGQNLGEFEILTLAALVRLGPEAYGVTVREERLVREVGYHVRSGACRLHGQDVLLLDSVASVSERIEAE